MKRIIMFIGLWLIIACITSTVLAAYCLNMGGSKSDVAKQCINCVAETFKADNTACSYVEWNVTATIDCVADVNPSIDTILSVEGGVIGSKRTFSGGQCSTGSCDNATGGSWVDEGTVNIYTSFICE